VPSIINNLSIKYFRRAVNIFPFIFLFGCSISEHVTPQDLTKMSLTGQWEYEPNADIKLPTGEMTKAAHIGIRDNSLIIHGFILCRQNRPQFQFQVSHGSISTMPIYLKRTGDWIFGTYVRLIEDTGYRDALILRQDLREKSIFYFDEIDVNHFISRGTFTSAKIEFTFSNGAKVSIYNNDRQYTYLSKCIAGSLFAGT